jgi:dihydrodipicolinate synthase/N-acetylneuraminate lyase
MQLSGIFGPVVTTFDAVTGELDRVRFAANVRAHVAAGLDGIVVAGSTGEAPLLDEAERRQLIETAREATPRERLLVAGVGAEATRTTVRRCRDAATAGAEAVLVVSPHYYTAAMTPAALLEHFRRVADESPVPVVLYNIPKYVGFALSPSLVAELAAHGNIVGIKDSSGDRDLIVGYLHAQGAGFSVLTGSGSAVQASLSAGARGAILAVALFAPALSREVYDAVAAHADAAATDAQARLAPLAATIVGSYGVAGVKAALDVVGLQGGPVRPPLQPLGQPELARVRVLLAHGAMATSA